MIINTIPQNTINTIILSVSVFLCQQYCSLVGSMALFVVSEQEAYLDHATPTVTGSGTPWRPMVTQPVNQRGLRKRLVKGGHLCMDGNVISILIPYN